LEIYDRISSNSFNQGHYLKHLIIVESPAKARTIKNFLGKEYEVIASKGHIRDLPKSSFGITEDDGKLIPKYSIAKENAPIVKQIKELAKKSDTIYIATDEDREGEAIGWHIAHAIKKDPEELPRIVFHEITKKAIIHALETPRKIDMNLVNAQQTRRLLDRIVGYKLSPLLASKIQKGLSGGRVQSSSLKIIVDREREIKAFIPVEYWTIDTIFNKNIDAAISTFLNDKIGKMDIKNEEQAHTIVSTVQKESFIVSKIEKKNRKTSTPAPFMTSTIQQTASSKLGFTPKKTMMIAQSLYEGVKLGREQTGLITYMRTDSLNLAAEAVESVRKIIGDTYGDKYLPAEAKTYNSKAKGAQEAHEAIRPTNAELTPQAAREYLKDDEYKLYKLIYERFLACQMNDAQFEQQSIVFKSNSSEFKANGRKLIFDGFYKVLGNEDKDKLLPDLKEGDGADLSKIEPIQHFTEPPARYSEASLIKKLESMGIGRPSTYAPTISTLQARDYLKIEKRQLIPTEIAFTVTEMLEKHFSEIVDSQFTANMEQTLDEIAGEDKDWQKILWDFYHPFMEKIAAGKENIVSLKTATPTGEMCPKCGSELLLRKGRYGEFVACSGFPKCRYTKPAGDDEEADKESDESDEKCDKCGKPMVVKTGRNGQFLACSGYPECKSTKPLNEKITITVKCPECEGSLLLRHSRRGSFYGCENYPKCTFISKFEPVDKKCSECNYIMAKRTLKNKEIFECIKCKHKVDA